MSVERLLVVALFLLAVLVQLLYRRVVERAHEQEKGRSAAAGREPALRPPAAPAPVPPRPAPVPAGGARGRQPAPPERQAAAPPRPRRWTRRDLRRGIVLVAVLGPCRGLETAPLPARSPVGDLPHAGSP
jgi:hypothetical protein